MLVDHFEVKEENKDLEADPQTECSEAKGGLLEEASIRTGLEIYQANSKRKQRVKSCSRYLQNNIKIGS